MVLCNCFCLHSNLSANEDGEDTSPLDVGSVNIQLNPEQNSDSSDENNSSDSDDERYLCPRDDNCAVHVHGVHVVVCVHVIVCVRDGGVCA